MTSPLEETLTISAEFVPSPPNRKAEFRCFLAYFGLSVVSALSSSVKGEICF